MLQKEDIIQILDKYNLGKYRNHKYLEHVLANDVYILRTEKGKFILKASKLNKLKHFREQLELVDFLYSKKIPVAKYFRDRKGKEIVFYRDKKITIQEFLEGTHPKRFGNILIKDLARNIGKMHKVLLKSKFKIKRKTVHRYKKRDLEKCPERIIQIRDDLLKKLRRYKDKKLKVARIHGDISEINLLVKNNKLKAFIDFEDNDYDYLAYDIAIFIAHAFIKRDTVQKDKIKLFLKEYQKNIKLSKDEKELTYHLIKYRLYGILHWYLKYTKRHPERAKQFKKGIDRTIACIENFHKISLEDFLGYF